MNTTYIRTGCALAAAIVIASSSSQAQDAAMQITMAEAQAIVDAGHKAAGGMNLRVSVAVVDARGDVIAVGRMTGAGVNTVDTAIGKAMTSAIYGQPSASLTTLATNPAMKALSDASGGRLRFIQGAVPIVRKGFIVGAVGASGATSAEDEQIAKAGAAALP